MSGFVAMLQTTGASLDRALSERLTAALSFRGPDGQKCWSDGPVGLGHAWLRTAADESPEQPLTLDDNMWISGDVRLDGREELRSRLSNITDASDATLLLHAYAKWGEECLQHLIGDYTFALWDGRRRQLFCGRDHFGVKPLFYAVLPGCFLASNSLTCLRTHPAVSDRLNDLPIGDFLLFGYNQNPATTAFADIQRLPAAHGITCAADGQIRLRRIWTLPTDEPIKARRPAEVVELFRDTLRTAVRDRLRTDRVCVAMSGGLDSTSVAALAREALPQPGAVRAATVAYAERFADPEGPAAQAAADGLGIGIDVVNGDNFTPFEHCHDAARVTPEPLDNPVANLTAALYARGAGHARVWLTGQGGDVALSFPPDYFLDLLRSLQVGRWLAEVGRQVWETGRPPPLGLGHRLRRLLRMSGPTEELPPWLAPEVATKLDFPGRWRHPPDAATSARELLQGAFWPWALTSYDADTTGFALEFRHPFFDERLIRLAQALPPMPWRLNKAILRQAMSGLLPDAVRTRPKVWFGGDRQVLTWQQGREPWPNHLFNTPSFAYYVNISKLNELVRRHDPHTLVERLGLTRAVSLAYWLHCLER